MLVTGGTRGVGRGIAGRFDRAGARVIVCARYAGDDPLPSTWTFAAADLRDGEQASTMIDEVIGSHGRLDVVVNNAGGSPPVDTTTASPRFTERIVALNLLAPIYVSQRANHHMQTQADGGTIVNIASVAVAATGTDRRRVRRGQGRTGELHQDRRPRSGRRRSGSTPSPPG